MRDVSGGFQISFSIGNITLREQQEIFQMLMKHLNFHQKDNLKIVVIDPVNGEHDIFEQLGVAPSGKVCTNCCKIDCSSCYIYNHRM